MRSCYQKPNLARTGFLFLEILKDFINPTQLLLIERNNLFFSSFIFFQ